MPPNRITAATLAAMLTLGAVSATPAAAAPPPTAAGTAGGTSTATAAKVTLITGDVVEVTDAGAGKKAATVRPAAGRERVTFHTIEVDGGLRVLPSDAVPYISTGVLDADLFDVEELVADGYGDSAARQLPLIVKYDQGLRGSQDLAGTTTTRELNSIGGKAVDAAKDQLPELWKSLKPAVGARALNSGVSKIWLDGKVRAVLDKSVPQIGAPSAWQAGYEGSGVEVAVLDTGVDAEHPDLAGKVQQAQDFSGSPTGPADRFGHGTHVAATIAGAGAGAGGTRKGVAPKADLLVGKVLGDDGYGYESWIIAGMEWAAAEGAKVVNMSLGGGATDGTDPMSQAVNDITARTGTLFVVSAGNEGQDESIGTPGAAASALTVAAVDRNDALADFSSRGPRLGDAGLKPEISAPGVGIVAARAAGTAMGGPVDDLYTAASGTSMAAPHVAGAAALLAQQHPDWKADQLKNALVSTAKTQPNQSVYAHGAGRVDLSRAVSQQVFATGVADFGLQTSTDASARTVTYRNESDAPVTLTLSVAVTNLDNAKPETDAFGVPASVTVPGERQHRRTGEPGRGEARPWSAQRLDRCHRHRRGRHPHRGRRAPAGPEAQDHAARHRPGRSADRGPGRLPVRRQLALRRPGLDPGRREHHGRGRGGHVPAARPGRQQQPAGRAVHAVHRPEHRRQQGHRGRHRRPQGGADHDRDAQAVGAAGDPELLRAPGLRQRPLDQPRRDALQHGQAGQRDPDQAGHGGQLRVLVPLATGRADGPGVGPGCHRAAGHQPAAPVAVVRRQEAVPARVRRLLAEGCEGRARRARLE